MCEMSGENTKVCKIHMDNIGKLMSTGIILLLLLYFVIMQNVLNICAWNVRSLNIAKPYLQKLSLRNDIMFISEHRLYSKELYKLYDIGIDFDIYAKSSKDLKDYNQNVKPGHCGVAMMWSRSLSHRVRTIECESDRICAIEVIGLCSERNVFVIGVYLPHSGCTIADFKEELDVLSDLICKCKQEGEVIIIGDTNCNFSENVAPRFKGVMTKNARALLDVIQIYSLEIFDGCEILCSGPRYTFEVEGVGSSYIDHCFGSAVVWDRLVRCDIIAEDILNTSDHLPIAIAIKDDDTIPKVKKQKYSTFVAWGKIDEKTIQQNYTNKLEGMLVKIYDALRNGKEVTDWARFIDDTVRTVCNSMKEAALNLPKRRFNEKLKPYWNTNLTRLTKEKKKIWHEWVDAGRPRGETEIFIKYKEAKKTFVRAQREAIREYEMKEMEKINECEEMNIQHFWYLVNRKKKKIRNTIHPLKTKSGKILTKTDDIKEEWKQYFEDLYTPKLNPRYDREFKEIIDKDIENLERLTFNTEEEILKIPITEDEVQKTIKKLKCKKAPGWDNIVTEHIKHGGPKLLQCLTMIYQLMTKHEHIPLHFKKGVIVPIPKGEKNKMLKDNYRGLTLLPVIGKLYEKIVICRVEEYAKRKNIIHKCQGAGKEKCSNLQVAWVIKETIVHNIEKGRTIYVGVLDARKAFDTVWQNGLFHKLFHYGVRGKAWRLIKKLYDGFECQVKIGGIVSEAFPALQGIHQGAPCSMFNYEIFNNELLELLQTCLPSNKICNIVINTMAYADDVTIIAQSKATLQSLFNIADKYSRKWQFEYNPNKCKILVYGKDINPEIDVYLGNHKLIEVDKEPHLGVVLARDVKYENDYVKQRIASCNAINYSIQSLGSYVVPVNPKVACKLHHSVTIPKLCYGVEILDISDVALEQMETFQGKCAKVIQALPIQTSNVGSITTVGFKTIEATIEIMRLMFLWRMLLLPISCIYKIVLLRRLMQITTQGYGTGPVNNIIDICKKYGLMNFVLESIEGAEYITLNEWKKRIKEYVMNRDIKRLNITCKLYKSLDMLKVNTTHRVISWWLYASRYPQDTYRIRTIVRLLFNNPRLGKEQCNYCNLYDTREHILFQCTELTDSRKILWNEVVKTCPKQLLKELSKMSVFERTKFILNGFNCKYTPEWDLLYASLSNFCYIMYNIYKK